MNGDQAVFEDFSLGIPALPAPSNSLTRKEIEAALNKINPELLKTFRGNKAKLLKLYETHYP